MREVLVAEMDRISFILAGRFVGRTKWLCVNEVCKGRIGTSCVNFDAQAALLCV